MTIKQALKMSVGYPIDDPCVEKVAIDRSINLDEEYTGITVEFLLAQADIYMMLSTSPNVSMDGFTINIEDRNMLSSMARSIYLRYSKEEGYTSSANNTMRNSSHIW